MNNIEQVKNSIKNVKIGKNIKIIQPVNIYDCEIGDNCFIGPFVEIQKNVIIKNNCKIQSHTFICELVNIGESCFIGHGVIFINDKFIDGKPANRDTTKWRNTIIGNNVSIGSNATILPVEICDGCVIGAGAVVTKKIEIKGVYVGNPAKLLKKL
jgi:acetyltransferase-like isoleucine patch superfamily enzyme